MTANLNLIEKVSEYIGTIKTIQNIGTQIGDFGRTPYNPVIDFLNEILEDIKQQTQPPTSPAVKDYQRKEVEMYADKIVSGGTGNYCMCGIFCYDHWKVCPFCQNKIKWIA